MGHRSVVEDFQILDSKKSAHQQKEQTDQAVGGHVEGEMPPTGSQYVIVGVIAGVNRGVKSKNTLKNSKVFQCYKLSGRIRAGSKKRIACSNS